MARHHLQCLGLQMARSLTSRSTSRTGLLLRHGHGRYYSSTPKALSTGIPMDPIMSAAAPPTAPKSRSTRYLRRMIMVLSFFLVGSIGGTLCAGILIPPPLPIPDSEDEAALLAKIRRDLSALNISKELRSPENKADGWIEYETFMGLPEEIRDKSMSAGALRGARGLGVRRMWWNSKRRELVGIVFLGGGVAGWPGVVHGGALATIMMESIGTVGNGGPREIRGLLSAPENVEKEMVSEFGLRYIKPTNANRLFIIRAGFEDEQDDRVTCSLEDVLTGKTTVIAHGKVGRQKPIIL